MVEQFAPAEAGHTIIRVDGRDIISSTAVRALAHLALAAPTVYWVQYTVHPECSKIASTGKMYR